MVELSQNLVDFLTREYLFQGLSFAQIRNVAQRFTEEIYEPGQQIVVQGQRGDKFYIVRQGKAKVTFHRSKQGKEISLGEVQAGDYFGEEAVLKQRPRAATVTALTQCTLLMLNRDGLLSLLADQPQIEANLHAAIEGRELNRRLNPAWVGENEVLYLIFRKHPFFLWLSLLGPGTLFLVSAVVISLGIAQGAAGFVSQTVGGIFAGVAILWALWDWIDWGNDYYILTSRRVIRLDKVIALYDSRNEAPLDSVTSSEVNTSWLGRMLDYGDVNVQTFTGQIRMPRMKSPYQFAAFVDAHKNWAVAMSREQEVQKMADELGRALRNRGQVVAPGMIKARPLTPPPPPPKKPSAWQEVLRTFLKVRFEKDGAVTYRKHWLILLAKIWQPLLSILILLGVVGTVLFMHYLEGVPMPLTVTCSLGPLIFTGLFLWLLYHYVDWSNDRYIIAQTQIIDIEKKPLGTENKKTANLDSQDFRVEHTRDNIINILFDYGNVVVKIGQTQFTFDWVHHPDQVHQDVVHAREALMQRKKREEAERGNKQMIEWLVMYQDQLAKMEHDQDQPPAPKPLSG